MTKAPIMKLEQLPPALSPEDDARVAELKEQWAALHRAYQQSIDAIVREIATIEAQYPLRMVIVPQT